MKQITQEQLESVREQIQEDLLTYMDGYFPSMREKDELCQIIVDNFNNLK